MNPMVAGALISTGGGFLSGLLGQKSADKQHKKMMKREEKYKKRSLVVLRQAAEAAGFNPLTALRATGGQLAGSGVSPVMSSSSALGDAIQAGTSYLANAIVNHDPMAAQREQLEQELMREQISTLQYERAQDQTFGRAPVRNGYMGPVSTSVATGTDQRGGVTSVASAPAGFGLVPSPFITPEMRVDPATPFDLKPAATNEMNTASSGMVGGFEWRANPNTSDAALWEERYGDIGGALALPIILGSDIGYNAHLYNEWSKAWRGTRAEARTKDWARNEVWGRVQRPN